MNFFPSIWGFVILILPTIPAIVAVWAPEAVDAYLMMVVAIVIIALGDLIVTPKRGVWKIRRILPATISIGVPAAVEIEFYQSSRWRLKCWARDGYPEEFESVGSDIVTADVPPCEYYSGIYRVKSPRRGDFVFAPLYIRYRSLMGFWNIQIVDRSEGKTKVYPDVSTVRDSPFNTRRNIAMELGMKKLKLRGCGTEFEHLREYCYGDEIRTIDWKATARRNRPITREYQLEKNNDIIFALDSGRLMHSYVAGMQKLDHAINASVMGSYISLQSGDKAGIVSFCRSVERFLPPAKGRGQMSKILDTLYAVQPKYDQSMIHRLIQFLMTKQRRRALVIIFTDWAEFDEGHDLLTELIDASRRHLFLFVAVRDPWIRQTIEKIPEGDDDLFDKLAAYKLWEERKLLNKKLAQKGINSLDLEPIELSTAVINKYIEIKTMGKI